MNGLRFGVREAVIALMAFFVVAVMYITYEIYAPFACLNTKSYKYPGNGLEYFSVDKRISNLEKDIWAYSHAVPGVRKENDKVIFQNVIGYKFKSPKEIAPGEFSLEVKFDIENGQCNIGIGNILLSVKDSRLIVLNGNKAVYQGDAEVGNSIIVDNFRDSKGALWISIATNRIPIEMPRQKLESHAYITIELSDGFTGSIGPWMWRRG